jgi:hypothetical protein
MTAEITLLELGVRARLYLTVESLLTCECHAWWGPALMYYSRDYTLVARTINEQLADRPV